MDSSLIGEVVVALDAGQSVPGFWMASGGNNGTAGVEVFLNTVASAFEVHLYTKSSDSSDAAAYSIGSVVVSTTGASTLAFSVSEARDLVRYQVESLAAGVVHLQVAKPLWQTN